MGIKWGSAQPHTLYSKPFPSMAVQALWDLVDIPAVVHYVPPRENLPGYLYLRLYDIHGVIIDQAEVQVSQAHDLEVWQSAIQGLLDRNFGDIVSAQYVDHDEPVPPPGGPVEMAPKLTRKQKRDARRGR